MLSRELNEGSLSGQKALEAEGGREKQCKGPGAAVTPPVSQEKAPLLGRQPMPGLIMGC